MHVGFVDDGGPLEGGAVETLAGGWSRSMSAPGRVRGTGIWLTAVAEFRIQRLLARHLKLDGAAETLAVVDLLEVLVVVGEGVGGTVHAVLVDHMLLLRADVAGVVVVCHDWSGWFVMKFSCSREAAECCCARWNAGGSGEARKETREEHSQEDGEREGGFYSTSLRRGTRGFSLYCTGVGGGDS